MSLSPTRPPLSVLDLAPIVAGSSPADAYRNTLALAQHAEQLGYLRYWLAEHHSMPGIASAATSVLIGYVAGGTQRIRVGSGGIMLPNHAPLVIAEQFGTLESLYPGRIDLGLGRAPGTDHQTMQALRRSATSDGDDFPQQLAELRGYLADTNPDPGWRVRAVPGAGLDIPIWLLGSSGFSAQLAGHLGLPFSFAGHFAPTTILPALDLYRRSFRPGKIDRPYAKVALNVIVAETDEEARFLSTTLQLQSQTLARGLPAAQLRPPVLEHEIVFGPGEKAAVDRKLSTAAIGSPATVIAKLDAFLAATGADEIMAVCSVYEQQARLRSYALLAQAWAG